jgi:hypothetical protein
MRDWKYEAGRWKFSWEREADREKLKEARQREVWVLTLVVPGGIIALRRLLKWMGRSWGIVCVGVDASKAGVAGKSQVEP